MKLWRYSAVDAILAGYSVVNLGLIVSSALLWDSTTLSLRLTLATVLVAMTLYNIIVVSHLFTHVHWFAHPWMNGIVSLVNSINIGQSVQAYELTHVRNHHRHNNDAPDVNGETKDRSSTYRNGQDGDHVPLHRYALLGAATSVNGLLRDAASALRLWRLGPRDAHLLKLTARPADRARRELNQVRFDRAALTVALVVLSTVSWQWLLTCYLPAFFCATTLVNVQNYYRHYGADPNNASANSVSHYGYFYNLLTFNDGYHQEHHISPRAHWSQMPTIRVRFSDRLDCDRVISPVPALLGFLHRTRPQLHRERAQ